jgi:Na+-driven multidrug efflux pump
MARDSRLKRRVAHALRSFTRGTVGRRSKSADTMRELLALAWPIMTAMAGETVMGLVDTKLVGGLGAAALGGVGVAMTVVFLGLA